MRKGKSPILAAIVTAAGIIIPQAVQAVEPAHFSVMGIRLYMSAQEVVTALYAQGVREDGVAEHVHSCALHAAQSCTDRITARLADGPITVRFVDAPPGFNDGREAAFSIAYRPDSGGEVADVRELAEERFGALENPANGAWCAGESTAGSPGACPNDRPRMAFHRNGDGASELVLTDFGLPSRLTSGEIVRSPR